MYMACTHGHGHLVACVHGCMRLSSCMIFNLYAQVHWVGTTRVQATLNNPISVGENCVWATLFPSQGGIDMGPRPQGVLYVFIKNSN